MIKEDMVFGLLERTGRVITLEGTPSEVKKELLSWANEAFPEVQRSIKKRKVDLWGVETLIADLRNGRPYSVRFDHGGTRPSKAYRTGAFLGAFHRLGEQVRLRATVICRKGKDPYAMAYTLLAHESPLPEWYPPKDPDLLARAIVYPERARLMERLDLRRRNLELLRGVLPSSLAKPLVAKVERIQLESLVVWEGVALYREDTTHWLVFDGKAHRLNWSEWQLVQRVLMKKGYTPLERARMAMLMIRLAK